MDRSVLVVESSRQDTDMAVSAWQGSLASDVIVVRGDRARTAADAYDEIAAAFQFPLYFGHNLMAMEDLLTDLEWRKNKVGWIMLLARPELFLVDDPLSFGLFVDSLMAVKCYWAGNERDDYSTIDPNLPFNIVLGWLSRPTEVGQRFAAANVRPVYSNVFPG